ncbi:LSU ribosomal protein L6P [Methanothermus fervidus DSM 2088]|uniref:Large ribosomal subunit protein uL6 n=1 Tax=Methanothermus fervidus (strain ATCC 43054 / DSM 2088 / JCM 10308 / V24 S) TaxID=523846 RepID=E3GZD5_METFV|nr:50S ribosomal protein L6 [Methanothermus fervidus]ADP77667.1 LSU ribosomal protein L6P [Methanothermus fervidus DSM 2088]
MVLTAIIKDEIQIPDEVDVKIDDHKVKVKGPKGELSRKFDYPNVKIIKKDEKIILESRFPRKKDKAMLGTIKAHIKNMIKGVTKGFKYTMKIVYAHFPMSVKVSGRKVIIENFLGERHPRVAKIVGKDTKVEVKDDKVYITGINKEHVGQTMANIEQATKIKRRDPRVFQDGIYLVSKE